MVSISKMSAIIKKGVDGEHISVIKKIKADNHIWLHKQGLLLTMLDHRELSSFELKLFDLYFLLQSFDFPIITGLSFVAILWVPKTFSVQQNDVCFSNSITTLPEKDGISVLIISILKCAYSK